ncbi:unnamed protein product [Prorocentrum cordatum]|uniref:Uncharacterized protein n=1 Tax=Prorocentrum cordatum TaxID=2364126 RepID=A0ABN9UN27_9DINO|nr:unnamed protein product [Polarella glacialis]
MTGAADARDAGACSPPRRDGAPSAVSTGDQSAATAAQADAWRAKLAEELGEWSWPERCLGRGYCIEVGGRRSPAEGGRRGGQGRLPLRGVRVGLGHLPGGLRARESPTRGVPVLRLRAAAAAARARTRPGEAEAAAQARGCARQAAAAGPCWVAALCMTGRKGTLLSLQDVLCNCFFSNRDCGNMQRWSNVRP